MCYMAAGKVFVMVMSDGEGLDVECTTINGMVP